MPREACELALAHVNSDRVEAAYRRSDLFERRRALCRTGLNYLAVTALTSPTLHVALARKTTVSNRSMRPTHAYRIRCQLHSPTIRNFVSDH